MIELSNSRHTTRGDVHVIDSSIEALQWRETEGAWQDIIPTIVPDANGWHVEGTPYAFEVSRTGDRRIFPDRTERGKFLHLPAPALLKNLTPVASAKTITFPSAKYDIVMRIRRTGIQFQVVFKKAPIFDRITLDYDAQGLDIQSLLMAKTGLGIPRPRITEEIDSPDKIERFLEWSYKAGQLELGFDLTGMKLPARICNTTLNLSVGASKDDDVVSRLPSEYWSNTHGAVFAGNYTTSFYKMGSSMRFTGVNIPAGAILTANATYLTLIAGQANSETTVNSDLCCEHSNNPGQTTSYANHIGRARTVGVPWDNIAAWAAGASKQSPYFESEVQDVVDDHAGTGDALIVFWEDKDGESSTAARRYAASWDHASYNPPAIHIEYTEAVTGRKRRGYPAARMIRPLAQPVRGR